MMTSINTYISTHISFNDDIINTYMSTHISIK